MTWKLLLATAILAGCAHSLAAENLNTARRVHIAIPQYSYQRFDGTNRFSSGFDVAVTITDRYYSVPSGRRMTPFVQAMAGPNNCFLPDSPNGLSLGLGAGMDVGVKPWLGVRVFQAHFELDRTAGSTAHGLRLDAGLVFRIGKR